MTKDDDSIQASSSLVFPTTHTSINITEIQLLFLVAWQAQMQMML
jgi:hypothetical protein